MNNLSRLRRIFIRNWAAVCYSCGWFYAAADSNSGRGIRVLADSILWLTGVPPAGYVLRLCRVLAAGYKLPLSRVPAASKKLRRLEFRRLDASCDWFYPAANSSSGGLIRVAADSVPRLTWVPVAGYKLQLTPSYGWLEFLDCWIRRKADSILQLTQVRRLDSTCGWLIL